MKSSSSTPIGEKPCSLQILRNIWGSPPYWQHELHDVLAMLRCIGIPTWFLTLSAADLHCPEMIQAVSMQFGRQISQKEVLKMTMEERSKHLWQNPVTGAQIFQHRVEKFFTQYLLSDSNPIGQIVEYVIKWNSKWEVQHMHIAYYGLKILLKSIKMEMKLCVNLLINI